MKKAPFENDPELWDLLGKAKPTEVSPFFARNVLREVRQVRQESVTFFDRIQRARTKLAALTAACAVLAIGGVLVIGQISNKTDASPALLVTQPAINEALVDLEIILALDDLLAMEENTLWLETY